MAAAGGVVPWRRALFSFGSINQGIPIRRLGWIIMTVLAAAVAVYALTILAVPSFGPPFIRAHRAAVPLALYAHLGGGAAALALGAWQFSTRLRTRALGVHRWMGRMYLISVLVGGVGAIGLVPRSMHGMVTHTGFGLLAVVWLGTSLQAYRRIRARDIVAHQQWMLRSYSLTLAAVTLRIYLPLSEVAGIPFAEAYQAVSWLCWVPNLLVAEWWFVPRRRAVSVEV